jgi:putative thiamine transport system ATP-binding protein
MGATMTTGLHFEDFSVTLSGQPEPVVTLNRTIAPGACLALMGGSGRGKSTILSAVAGFIPAWATIAGRLWLDGRRIDDQPVQARRLGLMFQDDLLFPHLTVAGNLLFALPPRIHARTERRQRVEEALVQAGLAGFADRPPQVLSGGQRSRVALLRTLLSEPRALLLDEPFAKLDQATRRQIRELVFAEARRRALPVLLVSHDERDAEAAGAEVVLLPDLPDAPASGTGTGA